MSGRVPRLGGGGVAVVDTAGEGYFWGGVIYANTGGVATLVNAINLTRQFQFVLPWRQIVRGIRHEITTGGGSGKKFGMGLFDAAKNKLLETGALDANSTGVVTTAITAVTLEPGVYYFAWTSDSASTQARIFATSGNIGGLMDIRMGTANASSAGVLPATLGSLTPAGFNTPIALFLP